MDFPKNRAGLGRFLDRGCAVPEIPEILKALIAIIVLINPLEGIPIYLAGTASHTRAARLMVARNASLTVLVLLLGAMVGGKAILYLFGIQIASFTVAGGLIILLIALKMVLSSPKPEPSPQAATGDISIVPLGTPLLGGPGPISSVIVFSSQGIAHGDVLWKSDIVLLLLIVVAALVTYLSLRAAISLGKLLGDTGINVMTRLAGILVAAIAIQMIVNGLLDLFPALKQ